MDFDQELLFGVVALQTGLIDRRQFIDSYKRWCEGKDHSLRDVLVQRHLISSADAPHLDHLLQRALNKHHGDAKAALSDLSLHARQTLAALDEINLEGTSAGSAGTQEAPSDSAPGGVAPESPRYEFLNSHGSGGIGRIWRARDRQFDRVVAVKELQREKAGDATISARFFREAKLTGQLEHPGIVPVYELGFRPETNQPFYAMRLVQGRTLARAVKAYHAARASGDADPMDFVGLLNAFAAVCNTVAFAHSRGILHRDLKGQNVILGDFGEVVVLDWGVAKLVGQKEEPADSNRVKTDPRQDPTLTIQGEIIGTPAYMAPEQAEGLQDRIDQRTDIYGLGAMLYTILTGRSPFEGPTVFEVLRHVMKGSPTPPRKLCQDVPPALEEICIKAMARAPENRFATATELAQEVQRWQDVQRRQAEDALRRQSEILRSILDGMSEGVFVTDADGKLILINPAAERMIGRRSEETPTSTSFFRSELETSQDDQESPAVRAIRGEDVDDAEMFVRPTSDQRGIWISVSARPLRDQSGKINGAVVAFRDVTARKLAEEERARLLILEQQARSEAESAVRVLEEARVELRANEQKYRSLADLIPGIVWTARADGWIDFANQFWLKFTGLTMEQTEGSGWTAAVHPDDLEHLMQVWSEALQTGVPVEVEYRVRRAADGAYLWFLAQGRPVRDVEGRIVKWFGLLTGIEEHKQEEKALKRENSLVRLLHEVTVAAYEADGVEAATQAVVDLVCDYTGWPVGHAYFVDGECNGDLAPTKIWRLERPAEFESFVRVTETTRFRPGEGLPGRVLAFKKPLWVMDASRDDNFPRATLASELGVRGAFGFPVVTKNGVAAVLEFFTSRPSEPDDALLRSMAQIGIQLGQVFDRKRSEMELNEAKASLALGKR